MERQPHLSSKRSGFSLAKGLQQSGTLAPTRPHGTSSSSPPPAPVALASNAKHAPDDSMQRWTARRALRLQPPRVVNSSWRVPSTNHPLRESQHPRWAARTVGGLADVIGRDEAAELLGVKPERASTILSELYNEHNRLGPVGKPRSLLLCLASRRPPKARSGAAGPHLFCSLLWHAEGAVWPWGGVRCFRQRRPRLHSVSQRITFASHRLSLVAGVPVGLRREYRTRCPRRPHGRCGRGRRTPPERAPLPPQREALAPSPGHGQRARTCAERSASPFWPGR